MSPVNVKFDTLPPDPAVNWPVFGFTPGLHSSVVFKVVGKHIVSEPEQPIPPSLRSCTLAKRGILPSMLVHLADMPFEKSAQSPNRRSKDDFRDDTNHGPGDFDSLLTSLSPRVSHA